MALQRSKTGLRVAVVGVILLAAGTAAAQVRPGGGGFGSTTRPPAQDDAFLIHVLNRTTFGPTAESLAEIREMGADAWLWRQLHPEQIDDSAFAARLAADVPDPLDPTYQWKHFYHETILRARYTERQLQEVMTQFWDNHFDTVVPRGNNDVERHAWTDMERWERSLFRDDAIGSFRDLVEYSAKSQAMMYFLDNYRNNVASGNENYARELLELHTVGVDCGYNQTDVQEVAKVWTGWTGIYLVRDPGDPSLVREDLDGDGNDDFVFNPRAHDYFVKWPDYREPVAGELDCADGLDDDGNGLVDCADPECSLSSTCYTPGLLFPPGGYDDVFPGGADGLDGGLFMLDLLTEHPCTARFISWKLLQVFVADDPPQDLVDRIAEVFMDTRGDIRQVLWAIFQSPEFRDPAYFGGKVRTPLEYTLAALRTTGATVQLQPTPRDSDYLETYNWVRNQGMPLYDQPIPTGWEEEAFEWISANGFLQRWKYADRLMQWSNDQRPTYVDPMSQALAADLTTADEVIDHFTRQLIGRTVEGPRRDTLRELLLQGLPDFDPANGSQDTRLREMIANILGSPEFNKQ